MKKRITTNALVIEKTQQMKSVLKPACFNADLPKSALKRKFQPGFSFRVKEVTPNRLVSGKE